MVNFTRENEKMPNVLVKAHFEPTIISGNLFILSGKFFEKKKPLPGNFCTFVTLGGCYLILSKVIFKRLSAWKGMK